MPCYCYMLECADGSYYTGWTTDPDRRQKVHNAGRGARYTRSRRPVRLVFVELEATKSIAMRRERAIKRMTRREKQQLVKAAARLPKKRAGRVPAQVPMRESGRRTARH